MYEAWTFRFVRKHVVMPYTSRIGLIASAPLFIPHTVPVTTRMWYKRGGVRAPNRLCKRIITGGWILSMIYIWICMQNVLDVWLVYYVCCSFVNTHRAQLALFVRITQESKASGRFSSSRASSSHSSSEKLASTTPLSLQGEIIPSGTDHCSLWNFCPFISTCEGMWAADESWKLPIG